MHPLNYSKEDVDKLLNKKILINYNHKSRGNITVEGLFIRYQLSNQIQIAPTSLTLSIDNKEVVIDFFDMESITEIID